MGLARSNMGLSGVMKLSVLKHGIALVLWLAMGVGFTPLSHAQQAGGADAELIIMVVDFQGVVRQSMAAESIQQQVGVVQSSFQATYRALEERLRAMEQELADLRGKVSDADFVNRRRDFEREVTDRQREAQTQRARLDEALNQSMSLVRSTALEVIAEFADEGGVSLVLNKADIILSNRDLDRTADVLAELNRRLPSVEVDLSQPELSQSNTGSTDVNPPTQTGAESAND